MCTLLQTLTVSINLHTSNSIYQITPNVVKIAKCGKYFWWIKSCHFVAVSNFVLPTLALTVYLYQNCQLWQNLVDKILCQIWQFSEVAVIYVHLCPNCQFSGKGLIGAIYQLTETFLNQVGFLEAAKTGTFRNTINFGSS